MSDPVIVACPVDAWTLVATNVTAGKLRKLSNSPGVYMQTYRDTTGSAPTLASEGAVLFGDSTNETISAAAGIDIYVYCTGKDGSVRVDV